MYAMEHNHQVDYKPKFRHKASIMIIFHELFSIQYHKINDADLTHLPFGKEFAV